MLKFSLVALFISRESHISYYAGTFQISGVTCTTSLVAPSILHSYIGTTEMNLAKY